MTIWKKAAEVVTGTVTLAGYEVTVGPARHMPPTGGDPHLHLRPDGVIMTHGVCMDILGWQSPDGGQTWEHSGWGLGVAAMNRRDGSIVAMDYITFPAEGTKAGPYNARGRRILPPYANAEAPLLAKVDVPGSIPIVDDGGFYGDGVGFWRDIVEEADGTLLATGYGNFADNDEPPLGYPKEWGMRRFEVFVMASQDDGRTWQLRARVAGDRETGQEGFNESTMVDLGNGELLVVMRTGRAAPLYQTRSLDFGHTWSAPQSLGFSGLDPRLRRLHDGTVLLSSGTRQPDAPWDQANVADYETRYVKGQGADPLMPGSYIRLSRDGGWTYSPPLFIDNGVGQCYTDVVEYAPGQLLFAVRHNWRKNMPTDLPQGESRNVAYAITLKRMA